MSPLTAELDRYLTIRRSLGYDLRTSGRILRNFTAFAERENAQYISTALFLRWQSVFGTANRQTWAARLGMVRLFAQWLHCMDPKHETLPQGLIPSRYKRARPHIYTEDEARSIVETAATLPSINGIRPLSMSTLFGLIAVTGLRISEALSLDLADVDLDSGVLMLRRGKLGKARMLPVSDSTAARLRAYASERDRLLGARPTAFFISDHGARVTDCGARYTFASVCQSIGLRSAQKFNRHGRGPRIHDLRHTFAVRTLLNWYRTGKNPAQEMIKLTTYMGHVKPAHTLLVHRSYSGAARSRRAACRQGDAAMTSTLPALVQQFFTDRLVAQMEASPNTIAGYRDTFRLLLRFASEQTTKAPTNLQIADLDFVLVGEFLAHVENQRHNSARSRNARLAAIRSFFRYVAMSEPAYLLHCQKILAMPGKRYVRRTVEFLDRAEMDALLAAPDRSTWAARRDRAILIMALQTGMRVSEIVHLRRRDIETGPRAYVRCEGKGRKQRCTPLRQEVVKALSVWLQERKGADDDPLFPSMRGGRLSRDAVEQLVHKHTAAAAKSCPTLVGKRVSPHVLRHSTAMDLLHHGVDQSVIALCLGHESVETTQMYMHADLRLKEKALARLNAPESHPGRYRPDDALLAFLEAL